MRSFIRKRVRACRSNTDIESCQLKLARHYNWCHPAIPSSPTRIQWSNVFSLGSLAPRSASPSRPSPTNSPHCRSICPHAAPENNLPHTEYPHTCSSFFPPSIARTDRTTMLHKPLLPISQRKRKRAATFVPLTSPHMLEESTQSTLARVAKRPRCIVTERVRTIHREYSSLDMELFGLWAIADLNNHCFQHTIDQVRRLRQRTQGLRGRSERFRDHARSRNLTQVLQADYSDQSTQK